MSAGDIGLLVMGVGGYLLAFLTIPRILLSRRESGATLAWIMAIAIVPYLGVALFLLVGRSRFRRKSLRKSRAHDEFQENLDRLPEGDASPPAASSGAATRPVARDISKVAEALTGTPLVPGNAVQVFIDTDQAYRSMEEAILGARHHVHMMSYIFRPDEAGERFRDALAQKAREGLEVRLLVDGVGGYGLSDGFMAPLVEAGGRFGRFLPVFGWRSFWRSNLRNHRKILVTDGRVGFAGGLNIGEEYQGRKKRCAPWRDTHLRVEGPAVRRLQEVFADDWYFVTDEDLADEDHFPSVEPKGWDLVQVVDSGPDLRHKTIHGVFFTALNEATERVYITTPYFVPDQAMLLAMKAAAWRGVDIRILLPGRSDLPLVKLAGRSFYDELVGAGVKLYEHGRGILHAKTMVVDGAWSTIGSANMDIRSFRLNFEVNVLVAGTALAQQMESIFLDDLKSAVPVDGERLADRSRVVRMGESLARVLSPIL